VAAAARPTASSAARAARSSASGSAPSAGRSHLPLSSRKTEDMKTEDRRQESSKAIKELRDEATAFRAGDGDLTNIRIMCPNNSTRFAADTGTLAGRNPGGVECVWDAATQGSACRATLGCGTESRWDFQ
jgi:hypothetical protein